MRVIYKYAIPLSLSIKLLIPWGYKILSFQNKGEDLFIWVEVDPSHATTDVTFHIVATGGEVPECCDYIGTVVDVDNMVWHLYKKQFQ